MNGYYPPSYMWDQYMGMGKDDRNDHQPQIKEPKFHAKEKKKNKG